MTVRGPTVNNPGQMAWSSMWNALLWGRLVESAVGAPLVNTTTGTQVLVLYWRERNQEVDFVMHRGDTVAALAVKSGRRRELPSGIEAFPQAFSLRRKLLVGGRGMSLEEFLMTPATEWV